MFGSGDGTFSGTSTINLSVMPRFVAVGDLDNDGHLDLVTANASNLAILYGNGDGSFRPPLFVQIGSSSAPDSIALADFNRDGWLDIAVSVYGLNSVGLLIGDGQGGFQPLRTIRVTLSPTSIVAADFNGDCWPDLAVVGESSEVATLSNLGNGEFDAPQFF